MSNNIAVSGAWEQSGEIIDAQPNSLLRFTGWALQDGQPVCSVRVKINGILWSTAQLGFARPDVVDSFGGNVHEDCGWALSLDTTELSAQHSHLVAVEAMAASGHHFQLGQTELRFTSEADRMASTPATGGLFLDLPDANATIDDSIILISGWIESGAEALDSVVIEVDGEPVGRARCFIPRGDVASAHGGDPLKFFVGFQFHWSRPEGAAEVDLTAVAITATGGRLSSIGRRVKLLEIPNRETEPKSLFIVPGTVSDAPRGTRSDGTPSASTRGHASLGVGGGQLWLAELLQHLSGEPDLTFSVIAMDDGPLREDLERAGIPVHLTTGPRDGSVEGYGCRIDELTCFLAMQQYDVVFCNTIGTFFIADAARHLDIPFVIAVHEHFNLEEWWPYKGGQTPGSFAFQSFLATLRSAYRLVFEAESTRELYEKMLEHDNGCVIHYGVDIHAIDEYQRQNPRKEVRRNLGISNGAQVIVTVGTFEPRKSQASIVDVFERISSRHETAQLVLVGGGTDSYTRGLSDILSLSSERKNTISIAPTTRDIFPYYHAADLLLSASDIESMPRSFMEAMAFNTPIITTDVAGCKELVIDGLSVGRAPLARPSL